MVEHVIQITTLERSVVSVSLVAKGSAAKLVWKCSVKLPNLVVIIHSYWKCDNESKLTKPYAYGRYVKTGDIS